MKSGVYRIGLGNDWFYVGSTKNFARRRQAHLRQLENKNHHNKRAQHCWNKYGVFEWHILEFCDATVLLEREQSHLNLYFNDIKNVNTHPTAGSPKGHKHSETTKKNMSVSRKGRRHSAEANAKISASLKGLPKSDTHKANLSEARKNSPAAVAALMRVQASRIGSHHSAITKKRISDTLRSSPARAEHMRRLHKLAVGVPLSAKHRKNCAAAQSARRARERAEGAVL